MATAIRPCLDTDMGAVADLFMRVFRHTEEPASASMRSYFAEIYLRNPWLDHGRPSLVAVDGQERPVGFLGALPMPLRMRGRKLDGAIGGSFMVDRSHRDPLTAVRLLRRFLEGSQDLALTDTANPVAIKFWQGLDGHVANFQTMRWVLALRPAALGLVLANRHGERPLLRAANPVARLADRLAGRQLRPPSAAAELRDSTVTGVYDAMNAVANDGQLGFAGSLEEFGWLVAMMRRRTRFGSLQLLTLHAVGSSPRGALMYFPNRGGLGQVAFATTAPGGHGMLVAALRQHAFERGSVGLMGHADARLAMELRNQPCVYVFRNDFTVVHARDHNLIDPLLSGDVAMTRLTGEWWTRLQGDVFD